MVEPLWERCAAACGVLRPVSESPTRKRLRRPIVEAPDLADVPWLGVDVPPDWASLAGHVVVLDVFSTCDVASRHALDETRRLATRFADEPVVVLGVHTPRFPREDDDRRLRGALDEAGVAWPVARDSRRALWERYAIKAWPSRVVVDPDGYIVGVVAGEGQEELLTRAVAQTLEAHRRAANLATAGRFATTRSAPRPRDDGLRAPRGLAWLPDGRLFVAVEAGVVEARRVARGRYAVTRRWREPFVEPRGLCATSTALHVADRAAHVVRTIDLATGDVRTLVGSGALGEPFAAGGSSARVALRSPWGVARLGDRLVVSQAGDHRLWVVEPRAGTCRPWVGRGTRRLVDGPAERASFDQPCGLDAGDGVLVVADAGACAVREVAAEGGAVSTLVGRGAGDRDGPRDAARLQWPTDVACRAGFAFVADTLNGRLRVVSRTPTTYRAVGHVATLCGGHGELEEPSAVIAADASHDDLVIVADAGRDRLVGVDPVLGACEGLALEGA